jgi:hypothetical protein
VSASTGQAGNIRLQETQGVHLKTTLSTLAAASLLTLLTACGGSGADDRGDPPGAAGLSITTANKDAVARSTVTGGLAVSHIQTATDSAGSGQQPNGAAARAHALAALAQRVLAAGVESRMTVASGTREHPAALGDTQACGVSGSVTVTFDDRDGNGLLSTGDVLSVQFNACRDSDTSLYNGKAIITLTSVPNASQITAGADFQDVSSVQGGLTASIDGKLSISETDSDTDSTVAMTVGDTALTLTMASTAYNDVVTMASGLRITVDQQLQAQRTSTAYDGTLQAQSVPGGAVTLATVTPIVQLDADAYPSSGVLKARGAHGTLLITVLSATTVQEQLDADDDGTYESTSTVAWSALIPS